MKTIIKPDLLNIQSDNVFERKDWNQPEIETGKTDIKLTQKWAKYGQILKLSKSWNSLKHLTKFLNNYCLIIECYDVILIKALDRCNITRFIQFTGSSISVYQI